MAMVVTMLGMMLLSALGAALSMTTMSEMAVASGFERAQESMYAADAGLERALVDLAAEPDWASLPTGSSRSMFADGSPNGVRTLTDGTPLNLDQRLNLANCANTVACSASDETAATPARPWGANNPVWRLYAYGRLAALAENASPYYIVVLLADGPTHDANVLWLRAEAFGPLGSHHTVEEAIARDGAGMRVVSWRDLR